LSTRAAALFVSGAATSDGANAITSNVSDWITFIVMEKSKSRNPYCRVHFI